MFQMCVYSERTVDKNGIVTRTGEDALPYVNKAGMFVADGMGGGAGVAIMKIHSDCLYPETLAKKIIKISRLQREKEQNAFDAYIKENFSSLTNFTMRRLYQNPRTDTLRLKKSGYVGSHVLGAVMTQKLLLLTEHQNQYDSSDQWKAAIESIKDSLFEDYKKVIELLGTECAKVSLNKIDYYGTTLTAAFFKENVDSVDVIFLNCGDSRSYIWDADGFRQASEDQGRNGGMTSRFSLREDADVQISFETKTYKKPCSIICMTDGIYSTFGGLDGFHSTPLYMEGFFMNTLCGVSSMEEAQRRFQDTFDAKGQIDDSNSMVMASFGYNTYEELRGEAARRMEYLNTTYSLPEQPDDFLLQDYQKKLQVLQQEYDERMKELLQKAYRLHSVSEYCRAQIEHPDFRETYCNCNEISSLQKKIGSTEQKNREIWANLYKLAKNNFSDFVNFNTSGQSCNRPWVFFGGKHSEKKDKDYGRKYCQDLSERKKNIEQYVENLYTIFETVKKSADALYFDEKEQIWTSEEERQNIEWSIKTREQIMEISSYQNLFLQKVTESSQEVTRDIQEWERENVKTADKYRDLGEKDYLDDLVETWLSPNTRIEEALCETTIPAVRGKIIAFVRIYQHNMEQLGQLKIDLENVYRCAAQNYWNENSFKDITELLNKEEGFSEDPELREEILKTMEMDEELDYCQRIADKQKDVFNRYLIMHLSEVSEEKRADVDRCGWM